MSYQWQNQLRIYLADELAEVARRDFAALALGPLRRVLEKHSATMKCQLDAFADYVAEAEAHGIEGFPLYAEELDIATRLRAAGWSVLFTPEVEITHAIGVSTGGDRRPHRLVVMHSDSLYRYYARHRADGWRRVTLPVAWLALRARAEIAWLVGRVAHR